MSTAPHTPGPWRFDADQLSAQYGNIVSDAKLLTRPAVIATVCWQNAEANARLIAAAPDMLDVLETLAVRLRAAGGMTQAEQIEAANLVDAAISRAAGQPAT